MSSSVQYVLKSLLKCFGIKQKDYRVVPDLVNMVQTISTYFKPDDVLKKLQSDPKLVHELSKHIHALKQKLAKLECHDRAHAREHEAALYKYNNKRGFILIIAAYIGLMCCMGAICYWHGSLSSEALQCVYSVAGMFSGMLKTAYYYQFGRILTSEEHQERDKSCRI